MKDDRLDLAKGHIDNFVYQINHYNKILNANRSYYLTRSQPPFLTDMIKRVYIELLKDTNTRRDNEELQLWLKEATSASIKELLSVWLSPPRLDKIGLSKYVTEGSGIPPETENGHFDYILKPFANELGMSIEDYRIGYINGSIIESELDEFFKHDRAVRESGHDTSYRFDGICANVATIDLNCLVYKYETDLKSIINDFFDGAIEFLVRVKYLDNFLAWFENYQRFGVDLGNWDSKWARGIIIYNVPLNTEDSKYSESFGDVSFSVYKDFFSVSLQSNLFKSLSIFTRSKVNEYLWNDQDGLYHDYNCVTREQTVYISATNFFALWSEIASVEQAARMVPNALSLLTEQGGLASGTRESRGEISEDRPQRQWYFILTKGLSVWLGSASNMCMAWITLV